MESIIERITEDEARISSYVLYGDVGSGKTIALKKIESIKYIDFSEELKKFFEREMLSLTLFEVGVFFKYIERRIDYHRGVTVVDNLEGVQNILFNLEDNGRALIRFFDSMMMQAYTGKVVFVVSDIKKMKVERVLERSKLPKGNIICWRKKDVD